MFFFYFDAVLLHQDLTSLYFTALPAEVSNKCYSKDLWGSVFATKPKEEACVKCCQNKSTFQNNIPNSKNTA